MKHKKKVGAALGATALFASVLAVTQSSAQAAPNWDLRNRTTGVNVAVGDVINGYGDLTFASLINGAGVRIECKVPSTSTMFSRTIAAGDQLSAAPGANITLPITPDPVISTVAAGPKQGICRDTTPPAAWATGVAIDVTTSGTWSLSITTPASGSGVFSGTRPGSVITPAGAITFWDPKIGCGGTGPNVATTLTGNYTTPTGTVVPTANQALTATATGGCTMANTRLVTGSLKVVPDITFVY